MFRALALMRLAISVPLVRDLVSTPDETREEIEQGHQDVQRESGPPQSGGRVVRLHTAGEAVSGLEIGHLVSDHQRHTGLSSAEDVPVRVLGVLVENQQWRRLRS